ncbi:hypothetical protein INT43_002333 [Umbelopsis isabellina]|uniref:TPR-like protein n=1 Tax=Mortierella isabellina TaxID=91625 RepID=A0A8H7Q5W7_MORIS|nr:hypothetical protein INT43_002333 [Umbelopsis isabellina]
MTSAKAIQIAKDIDAARCKGNWIAIPELARRYKKHNPDGTVLEQTILAEHALVQVLEKIKEPANLYTNDSPDHLAVAPGIERSTINYAREQLVRASQPKSAGNDAQSSFAAVILARVLYEIGDFSKALTTLKQLGFRPEDVESGYALVLLVQARTIKGLCLEQTSDPEGALKAYESVLEIIHKHPSERGSEWSHWVETSLYRGSLLKLRLNKDDVPGTLALFREYHRQSASWSSMWRLRKRIVILKYFTRYLSDAYRDGKYVPSPAIAPGSQQDGAANGSSYETPTLFCIEIAQLHKIYEEKLYTVVSFPKAGYDNRQVLDFVKQLVGDLDLIGDAVTPTELRGLVEALYRATGKTFNSPIILRLLFITLTRLGEYDEAKHALKSYLNLIGLSTQAEDESRRNGEALVTYADGSAQPVPVFAGLHVGEIVEEVLGTSGVENAALQFNSDKAKDEKTIASKHQSEQEDDADILLVLNEAVRLFCKDLDQGVEAVEMAELAKKVLSRSHTVTTQTNAALCAKVDRMVGVAYSLLASQTHDPEVRPKYHETAIKYLNSSINIDSSQWETYYQLALQQAETRDIAHAIASVSQALRINSTHTPSWHLLTLLSSCPVAGNLNQAMQSYDLGMSEVDREIEQNGNGDAANSIYPSALQTHDGGEEMLAYQITGAVLRDALGDTDLALESHESLFALYGRVSTIDPTMVALADYGGTFSRKPSVIGSNGNVSEIPRGRRRSASASHGTLVMPRKSNSVTVSKSQDDVNNVRGEASYSTSSFGGSDSPRGTSSSLVVPGTASEGEVEKQLPNGSVQRSKSSHRRTLHMFSRKHKKSEIPDLPSKEANSSTDSTGRFNGKIDNGSVVGDYRSLRSPTPSIGTKASIRSIYQPADPGVHVTTRTRIRYKRFTETLSNLWLLSARAFLKLGKLEEARKAIEEAEGNDPSGNPRVWIVLGRLRLAQNRTDDAISAFQKALVVDPYDADGRLWLARTYIETGEIEAAEGLLDRLTKGNGWDSAEAWYYLGDIYKRMDRLQRAKECLWYALELENTKPILSFSVLPRCI